MKARSPANMITGERPLSLPEALKWIRETYSLDICFKTLYNWIHTGRIDQCGRRRRLKTEKWRFLKTYRQWIIEFIEEMR